MTNCDDSLSHYSLPFVYMPKGITNLTTDIVMNSYNLVVFATELSRYYGNISTGKCLYHISIGLIDVSNTLSKAAT